MFQGIRRGDAAQPCADFRWRVMREALHESAAIGVPNAGGIHDFRRCDGGHVDGHVAGQHRRSVLTFRDDEHGRTVENGSLIETGLVLHELGP